MGYHGTMNADDLKRPTSDGFLGYQHLWRWLMDPIVPHTVQVVLAALLVTAIMLSGLWDLYDALVGGGGFSVSEVFYGWSRGWPPFLLIMGFFLGHLFWPLKIKGG